ncbi:MAG: mannose-1-phosphate guanylyltransferase, partial [Oscillospiraceae bacterium]|nr:mannose-1-phosphate guanylyltransferase [Oscillospiraceae bacterium]
MHIILLSGGSGKRLWPLSNDTRSKQFIKIFKRPANSEPLGKDKNSEYESMVQRVYRQIRTIDTDATVTIATSKSQVSSIHNQLGANVTISVEPCRRDTFPAIALATAYLHDILKVPSDEAVVVCPVDPYVEDSYFTCLKEMCHKAEQMGGLVLMG